MGMLGLLLLVGGCVIGLYCSQRDDEYWADTPEAKARRELDREKRRKRK